MTAESRSSLALNQVLPSLCRTEQDDRPVVVMTCGISGAGKSTLSKDIIACRPNFVRLSNDTLIYERRGLYSIDYPAEKYSEYQDEARLVLNSKLVRLLSGRQKDVILDLAFWNREYRDEYKKMIEAEGARWVLVFLDADRDVLWRRVSSRRVQRDALKKEDRDGDSAYDISEEVFAMYCQGFERPDNEGAIVIKVE